MADVRFISALIDTGSDVSHRPCAHLRRRHVQRRRHGVRARVHRGPIGTAARAAGLRAIERVRTRGQQPQTRLPGWGSGR